MTLHLIKLCVGVASVADLKAWTDQRAARVQAAGVAYTPSHVTRMVPKKRAELIAGGSLYWVIKGSVLVRQRLIDVCPFTDDDGIDRCRLVLDKTLVPTRPQPRGPFQGWRYLKPEDAPEDDRIFAEAAEMPPEMLRELRDLCLI